MKEWFIYSLIALTFFSLWGIFGKTSTFYLKAEHAIVYESLGTFFIGIILFTKNKFSIDINPLGITFSLLIGISGVLGTLFYLAAMEKGHTAIVTFITALYPMMVFIFSYFILHEPMTVRQGFAIVLACCSIILFALE